MVASTLETWWSNAPARLSSYEVFRWSRGESVGRKEQAASERLTCSKLRRYCSKPVQTALLQEASSFGVSSCEGVPSEPAEV